MLVEVMVTQVEAGAEFQSKFSVGTMSPKFMSTVRFYAFALVSPKFMLLHFAEGIPSNSIFTYANF